MGFGGMLRTCLLIWFLLVGTRGSEGTKATKATIPTPRTGSLKRLDVIGRDTPIVHPDLDPNYMSKRRVPNGPDPIHNRRAGKSGQPAGRA